MTRWLLGCCAVLAGCDDDEGMVLHFEVTGAREAVSGIEVTVSVSQGPNDGWCDPSTINAFGQTEVDVAVRRSEVYGSRVAFLALARSAASQTAALRSGSFVFTPGEITTYDVVLDASCRDSIPCGDSEQCVNGACEPSEWEGVFNPADGEDTLFEDERCVVSSGAE